MSSALGKECCICSSLLNGVIFEYKDGYIGYNCCLSAGQELEGSVRRPMRINTALLTEEALNDYQLLAAVQSSVALKPCCNEPIAKESPVYFTPFFTKYKRL